VTELAMGPQVLHAIPPSEFVITAWYEVQFGEQTGGISLCFPLPIIDQVLPKLTGQTIFENRRGDTERTEKVSNEQPLPMMVPVSVSLGSARIHAIDIANLQPGDVLVLDSQVDDPLKVSVGNCEKLAGSPGTRGKHVALQITGAVDDDGYVRPFAGSSQ
jgi:flagellar motor switch protein FliM